MSKTSTLGKVAIGATVGAGLGILFAPKKGSEIIDDLKNKVNELITKVKTIDSKETKSEFNKALKELEDEIKDLDQEKILKITKEKALMIKEKVDNLFSLAIEKGNESLKKSTNEIKQKTIEVTKMILEKLEKEDN